MIYCDKHTCWHEGICPKCKNNEPAYIRMPNEINPNNLNKKEDKANGKR